MTRNGTPGFVPQRLVETREARGIITREALARAIGKSGSTVQRWEDGDASPEPDAVKLLAQVLNVRVEHFVRPSIVGEKPVFFRSLASALKKEKAYQRARMSWLIELSQIAQRYVELPDVDIPDVLGNTSFKLLRDEDLERIASELRVHWALGDKPCADVLAHMERVGFVVASEEMGTVKLDGLCQWSEIDERPYVLLAEDKMSFARRQMDAAHEMAHGILHRRVTEEELRDHFDLIEQQAFRLASAFLLPASSYPSDLRLYSLPEFEVLKDRWKVSIKAQIRRLQDLRVFDTEYARSLFKSYSAKGWNRGEPFDDVWPVSKPRVLAEALNAIVDAQITSKSELLAAEFTMPASDIESLCGLPTGWFGREQGQIIRLIPRNSTRPLGTAAAAIVPFRADDEE